MKTIPNDTATQEVNLVGFCFFATASTTNTSNEVLDSKVVGIPTKTPKPHYAFPTPEESYVEPDGSCFCTHERILKIYSKALNKTQQRLTESVEQWFIQTAKQFGWEEAKFIIDCSARKKAGCMLRAKPNAGLPYVATH